MNQTRTNQIIAINNFTPVTPVGTTFTASAIYRFTRAQIPPWISLGTGESINRGRRKRGPYPCMDGIGRIGNGKGGILWFLLILILSACGTIPANTAPTILHPPGSTPAIMTTGSFRAYMLPLVQSGIMRPTIDHQGRIWFGEMGHNYLAVFDPQNGQFQQMVPPHGANGIMGITVAADDSIWFAEQYANYIGHYFPNTQQFKIYPLPTITTPDPGDPHKTLVLPVAPNDIALDAHGNVWFTELNADTLGMLDIQTGAFKHYMLTPKKSVQTLYPYGIAIDTSGLVWFTESGRSLIGRLDPRTGMLSTFTTQVPTNALMEVACDAHGNIWATSFSAGMLVKLVPRNGTFTYYYAPYTGSAAGGIYDLTVTSEGTVWITVTGENTIARLDTAAARFVYYVIPTHGSSPFGLVSDTHNRIWFTAAGSDEIGMLQL